MKKLLYLPLALIVMVALYAGFYIVTKDIPPMTLWGVDKTAGVAPTKNQSPSTAPTDKPVIATKTQQTSKIECVGPDGVHFQTTRQECDEFNQAWGNTAVQPTTTQTNAVYRPPFYVPRIYNQPVYGTYPTVQLLPTIPPYQPLPTRPPANVYWHPNPPAPTVPYGFSN